VTTSSRKKGILPVRLGLEPDNKTALKELKMDPDLADKMTDEELDKLIIDKEYNDGLEYYKSEGDEQEGLTNMGNWRKAALKQIQKY
tara:strand:- start:12607 stop:12867 length:261 start_codon:yes stop_codon:yes gene_type:complete